MSILLFTDFGSRDIYVGQVKAVLRREAPGIDVIDLLHDATDYDVDAGAHLLAALAARFAPGNVFFTVIDPGVGGSRAAVVVLADEKWYVGPDNGLLSVIAQRARDVRVWRITWRPQGLSASFHGRDLFAPIAAAIARGAFPQEKLVQVPKLEVSLPPNGLARIIYIDHYGNCFSAIPAEALRRESTIECGTARIGYARTFSESEPGRPFWYHNSIGLVEIAVNRGNASRILGLKVGSELRVF